jgi:hypothetical protein
MSRIDVKRTEGRARRLSKKSVPDWPRSAVFEYPDDATAAASVALARSSGNFQNNQSIPLLNAEEFKATMQKAKDVKASTAYTAPTQTK